MSDILDHHFRRIVDGSASPTVIELGANNGYHTELMADILSSKQRSWKMLAMEPDERVLPHLKRRVERYAKRIRIENVAVGDTDGEAQFFLSAGQESRPGLSKQNFTGSSSILPPADVTKVWPDMTFAPSMTQVRRLDSFIDWIPPGGRVDFIWADIQGAEVKMIRGAAAVLARTRFLYTEYSNGGLYEGDASLADILAALPGWRVVEDYGGDILVENPLCQ